MRNESADGSRLSDVIIRQWGCALNTKVGAGCFLHFLPPASSPPHSEAGRWEIFRPLNDQPTINGVWGAHFPSAGPPERETSTSRLVPVSSKLCL